MELRRLLALLRQRSLLLVCIIAAGVAGGYLSTSRTPIYDASTTIFVGQPSTDVSADAQTGQALVATTFAAIVPSAAVAEAAVAATRVPRSVGQVVSEIHASVIAGTNLLVVSVHDPDPVVAQTLANGVSDAFVAEALRVAPLTSVTGQRTDVPPATVTQPAALPGAPQSSGVTRNTALGGLFALVVGIALVLLLDYVDLTARLPEELERRVGLPVLGVIPLQPAMLTRPGRPRMSPQLVRIADGA
jgi:capsular polysaccharide biosynthesis protein